MTPDPVIRHGDMRDALRDLAHAGETFHAVVTDPPYHLTSIVDRWGKGGPEPKEGATGVYVRASRGFMGKEWDGGDIAMRAETWRLVWDVLPPGGHLVAFGGTRTFHRMACAIEDAGFELRDTLMWLYGSGFPKSHDVSKGIDKAAGARRTEVRGVKAGHEQFVGRKTSGHMNFKAGADGFHRPWMDDAAARARYHMDMAPATEEAAEWEGWGTALKPAWEPIILARKPLAGTVAANCQAHRTGAINVDACRVPTDDPLGGGAYSPGGRAALPGDDREGAAAGMFAAGGGRLPGAFEHPGGRWPANVLHDGSAEVEEAFAAFGDRGAAAPVKGTEASAASTGLVTGERARVPGVFHGDEGTASRFFYCGKASARDRVFQCEGCLGRWMGDRPCACDAKVRGHPTVKPQSLMRWLCRLVTPPGGRILDCFAGSGSTLAAAYAEGFSAVGIELDDEYVGDIRHRLAAATGKLELEPAQPIPPKPKPRKAAEPLPLFAMLEAP
jgi:DNA modification methylase